MNQKQLKKMLARAQEMQAKMLKMQEDLAGEKIEGSAGNGMVRAMVSGNGELLEISISPEVVDPEDIEMLEDLILVAVKNAVEESRRLSEKRMEEFGMPGLGGLP